MKKHTLGILFGGRSAEHEVSINSAINVYKALDKKKYEIKVIAIAKKGTFHVLSPNILLLSVPEILVHIEKLSKDSISHSYFDVFDGLDVVFSILHGPYGEDGSMQGILKQLQIPFVGASVLGSAIGMDKDVSKRLLRDAGIPVAKFLTTTSLNELSFIHVKKELGVPLFIKPANLGSSIGISKVNSEKEFEEAMKKAFLYDRKVILEEAIIGREIECSVLGNDVMTASVPGEIISTHVFYDYDAKYIDEKGATLQIPADVSKDIQRKIQQTAVKTCKVLCVEGMARVDFFLTNENTLYVNEINTLPGFTNISMYPKLWEKSDIAYSELLNQLILLAIDRFNEESLLE